MPEQATSAGSNNSEKVGPIFTGVGKRLKAPGMFWRKENVEPMLYMRAQALTSRWDEMMGQVQNIAKYDRRRDVYLEPTPPCPKPIQSLLTPANSDYQGVAA